MLDEMSGCNKETHITFFDREREFDPMVGQKHWGVVATCTYSTRLINVARNVYVKTDPNNGYRNANFRKKLKSIKELNRIVMSPTLFDIYIYLYIYIYIYRGWGVCGGWGT
jgi:hypothetical protein